jgi:hypothetical protein
MPALQALVCFEDRISALRDMSKTTTTRAVALLNLLLLRLGW